MSESGPGGTRLPCPCAARHATAARMRVLQALAVAGLTALAVLCVSGPAVQAQPTASSVSLPPGRGGGSPVERITLIAIAVLAVGAFVVLQVIARSQRRLTAFNAPGSTGRCIRPMTNCDTNMSRFCNSWGIDQSSRCLTCRQ